MIHFDFFGFVDLQLSRYRKNLQKKPTKIQQKHIYIN